MGFRRYMAFTLGALIQGLIDAFKQRVWADYGAVDAEAQLISNLTTLNNKELFGTATLVMSPSGFAEGKLHSIVPTSAAGDFSFVRATNGYYTSSTGNIYPAAWEFNQLAPSRGIVGGVSSAPWAAQGLGGGWATGFAAPDGTLTASKLNIGTQTSRNDYGGTYVNPLATAYTDVSFNSNEIRTLLFYVKQNADENYVGVQLQTVASGFNYATSSNVIKIDLSGGTVVNNPTTYTATTTVSATTGGWYRVCVSSTTPWSKFMIHSSRNLANQWVTTGNSPLFWGFQIVPGTVGVTYPYYATSVASRANHPRIDNSTGTPAVLLENGRTNFFLRSEDFTNASWVKTNATVTGNSIAAPSLDVLADTLTATAADATVKQNAQTTSSNNGNVFSVWLKRKTGTGNIALEMGSYSNVITGLSSSVWTRYSVKDTNITGTYVAVAGAYTVTTSIPHGYLVGEGIRFNVTTGTGTQSNYIIATVPTSTTFTFTIGAVTSSGNCNVATYNGRIKISTSGDEVYAWGAQYESAQNFTALPTLPTTYIPSTTATVTRGTDTMSVTNLQSNSILASDFSVFAEISRIGGSNSSTVNMFGLTSTTGNTDYLGILGVSTGVIQFVKRENNGTAALTPFVYQPAENAFFKMLIVMSAGTVKFYLDGNLVVTTTFANPTLLTQTFIGVNHRICYKNLYMWNRALNSTEIAAINS